MVPVSTGASGYSSNPKSNAGIASGHFHTPFHRDTSTINHGKYWPSIMENIVALLSSPRIRYRWLCKTSSLPPIISRVLIDVSWIFWSYRHKAHAIRDTCHKELTRDHNKLDLVTCLWLALGEILPGERYFIKYLAGIMIWFVYANNPDCANVQMHFEWWPLFFKNIDYAFGIIKQAMSRNVLMPHNTQLRLPCLSHVHNNILHACNIWIQPNPHSRITFYLQHTFVKTFYAECIRCLGQHCTTCAHHFCQYGFKSIIF